jgi:hypothetical protein
MEAKENVIKARKVGRRTTEMAGAVLSDSRRGKNTRHGFREPRRLLSSTPFQSSSGACQVILKSRTVREGALSAPLRAAGEWNWRGGNGFETHRS